MLGCCLRSPAAENHVTDRASDDHGERTLSEVKRPEDRGPQALLARALDRAWWAILWERLWPALAAIATAVGLFLAASWAGLWLWLPPVGRAVVLFVLVVIAAGSAVPLVRIRR